MKTFFRILAILVVAAAAAALGLFYGMKNAPEKPSEPAHQVLSREGVLQQIKNLNRLESTAFYIDTIIRTEKKGNWYALWQDSQKGLFVVRGKVLAGLDLDKLTADKVNIVDGKVIISLPQTEILSVDLENIEVYDIQTGHFDLHPADKTVFTQVQEQARKQVRAAACKAGILNHAQTQAVQQLETLFALTQTPASVYPEGAAACR
ncbi:DUF4230 domain-containing protein [Neisseria sp.]|uniref:DUF4230 domain-containing protein n=1 Tax=Neisseria sp. TaxID=192066 RepID=UPI0035A16967